MNTEVIEAARQELIAAGNAAGATGQDEMQFFDAADALLDAMRATEAAKLVIAADAPTYWG